VESGSKKIWTIVVVVLAALALSVAGAYLAKVMTTTGAATGAPAIQNSAQAPRRGAGGTHHSLAPTMLDRNAQAPSTATGIRYR
jgi:hypothetical protein